MSKIAHYVILACPHCGKRHVRAEFASVSDPAFMRALDPPHINRLCQGCVARPPLEPRFAYQCKPPFYLPIYIPLCIPV